MNWSLPCHFFIFCSSLFVLMSVNGCLSRNKREASPKPLVHIMEQTAKSQTVEPLYPPRHVMVLDEKEHEIEEITHLKYSVGEYAQFSCRTSVKNAYIAWLHQKDNYTISRITLNNKIPLILQWQLSIFDNGTNILCEVWSDHLHQRMYVTKKIYFDAKDINNKPFPYNNTMVEPYRDNVTSYTDNYVINMTCYGDQNMVWHRIKDNKYDDTFVSPYASTSNKLPLKFSPQMEDDGAAYICASYSVTKNKEENKITRDLSKVFSFQRENSVLPIAGSSNLSVASNQVYIYSVIFGAAIFLVIIAVSTWRYCRQSPKTRLIPPGFDVVTYACASELNYACLDTAITSKRAINVDTTPYAQIIGVLDPQ